MGIARTEMEQDQVGHRPPAGLILLLPGTNAHPLRRQSQNWMITIQSHAALLLPGAGFRHSLLFSPFAAGEATPRPAAQTTLRLFPTREPEASLSGAHRRSAAAVAPGRASTPHNGDARDLEPPAPRQCLRETGRALPLVP